MKTTRRQHTTGARPALSGEGSDPAPSAPDTPRIDLPGFLVLPENRAAARAVWDLARGVVRGKRPRFNPLVLHGPPGSGKTALVTAALTWLARAAGVVTARAVPARELARPDDRSAFADPDLAACDFLVVEDVQHLPPAAADELCRLTDLRVARRLPLVLTAALGPARLTQLPRRLTSRLAGGLVVRLEPAGPAGRRRILAAAAEGMAIQPEALDWLAAHCGSLRSGLGVLKNLARSARGRAKPLDRSAIEEVLAEAGQPTLRGPDLDVILARVCAAFGVTRKDLLGPSRLRGVLVPRQVAMALARDVGGWSLPRIAAAFGRDHTTVLHACRQVDRRAGEDARLAATVRQLRSELV